MKEITHDLNYDLIFYCSHDPFCMPEDKVSVSSTWDIFFWQNYEFMFFENFKQLRLFLCSETNHCIKQAYLLFFCFLRTFLLQSTKFSNFIEWSSTSGNRLQLLGKVTRILHKLLRYINNPETTSVRSDFRDVQFFIQFTKSV